jgi:prevent-host-death family protein
MKTAALKEVKAKLSEYCEHSQGERVLITKHGKPLALMIGVEGRALEDVLTAMNPDFWSLIEERRREPTLSSAEMRKRLTASGRPPPSRRAPRAGSKSSKARARRPVTAK